MESVERDIGKHNLEVIEWLAKDSLFAFSKYVLGNSRLDPLVHEPLCDFLTNRVRKNVGRPSRPAGSDWTGANPKAPGMSRITPKVGKSVPIPRVTRNNCSKNKLVLLPRGAYKTTIISESLPLWLATLYPNGSTMLAAENVDQIELSMRVLENHILHNQMFRALYGHWEPDDRKQKWTTVAKDFSIKRQLNKKTPSLFATSVGTTRTGVHPDAVILDDIVGLKYLREPSWGERIREFYMELGPMLGEPGYRWVVGTRWGFDDYYNFLQTNPVMSDSYDVYVRACENPDNTMWCPSVLPEERVWEKARDNANSVSHFFSQYYQMATPQSEDALATESIKFFNDSTVPNRDEMLCFVGIDPADADGDGSGAWAVVTVGVTAPRRRPDGTSAPQFYQLEAEKGAMTASKASREAIKQFRKWRADGIVVEKTVISKTYIHVLKDQLAREGIFRHFIEVEPGGISKKNRIVDTRNSLGSVIEEGRFYIRHDQHALQGELQTFPSDATFDILDIDAYIVRFVNQNRRWPLAIRERKSGVPEFKDVDSLLAYEDEMRTVQKIQKERGREERVAKRRVRSSLRDMRRKRW